MSRLKNDRQVIIAWNSNNEVIKLVEDTFGEDVILKKQIQLTPAERAEKINQVYHPIHVPHNSSRCNYIEPLTLFVVQMEPKYRYYLRTEGYLLCNPTILDFKVKNRKKFNFELFHCSDSVEEAKKALKVFGLEEFIPKCHIVDVDKIYHIRHVAPDPNTPKEHFIEIHNLKDSVSVQYLMGYANEFLNQKYKLYSINEIHVVKSDSFEYLQSLPDFNQEHEICQIEAAKYDDNHYVIADGKHRSALLYFHGDRHIFVQECQPPCCKEHFSKSLKETNTTSHLDNLHQVIYSLHNNNIRYVVVRGYKTMPKTADTDLDIVIHPQDYSKFTDVMKKHLETGALLFNVEVPYSNQIYRAYRTAGVYNDFLTNKGYQLDTYSSAFFFGPNKNAVVLSNTFIEYLFTNRKKHYHLSIPNELSEMVLLFCRTHIDLGGKWKSKHRARFDEVKLSASISKDQFTESLKAALDPSYLHLLNHVDDLFV